MAVKCWVLVFLRFRDELSVGLRETADIRDLSNWRRHRSIIFRQSLRVVIMTFMS